MANFRSHNKQTVNGLRNRLGFHFLYDIFVTWQHILVHINVYICSGLGSTAVSSGKSSNALEEIRQRPAYINQYLFCAQQSCHHPLHW
jgi:hypothetical protein